MRLIMSVYDGDDWNPEDQTKCFQCGLDIPCLINGFNICSFCYEGDDEQYEEKY